MSETITKNQHGLLLQISMPKLGKFGDSSGRQNGKYLLRLETMEQNTI